MIYLHLYIYVCVCIYIHTQSNFKFIIEFMGHNVSLINSMVDLKIKYVRGVKISFMLIYIAVQIANKLIVINHIP
jgi:hypothetical protein